MNSPHPDEQAEKYRSLLHGLLAPIRGAHETPLHFEIDARGIAAAAWKDLLAEFPEVKHDGAAFSAGGVIAGLDGILAREPTAAGEIDSTDVVGALGNWLQEIFQELRSIDPAAIEIAGRLVEGFDRRAIAEGLDTGLRLVKRIARDIRGGASNQAGGEGEQRQTAIGTTGTGGSSVLISGRERRQSKRDRQPRPRRYGAWTAACRQLQQDGKRGKLPTVEALSGYLSAVPVDQQTEALQDLVATHLLYAWQTKNGGTLETYVNEIPALARLGSLPADLIEDELLARYQRSHGDFPDIGSYEKRFPSRPEVSDQLEARCLDGGRYVKLRRIGVGAVAVVWEAFDRRACREVAIKEPLFAPGGSTGKPHPFAVEARITAALDHPGIVSMVEVTPSDGGPPFYVMRMAGTETLADKIQQRHAKLNKIGKPRVFQEKIHDLLDAFICVCEAIEYAHGRGILHCDLKPENVACTERGDIGVIDWGLSIRMPEADGGDGGDGSKDRSAGQRRLAGTPHYMAPEQMDGFIDVRSEVFGLGAILYEILTAQPPYSWSKGGREVRPDNWPEFVRTGQFPRPRKIHRRIPKPLEAICQKAMALNPDERHSSAAALAEDLRTYLSGAQGPPWSHLD